MSVRVRFAPSPTGDPHIGNIRTALFNWLFARHNKGAFIVRVEDTDQERYVPGSLENILETLTWLGLDWDEGPGKDKIEHWQGDVGPYMQSERTDLYKKHVELLMDKDMAYPCFCSSARLEEMRKEQLARKEAPCYDRLCRDLTPKERLQKATEKYAIRLKVPRQGITKFKDMIHGELSFENEVIDDQVLLKSDGFPTYHLANVVDDHFMNISHVIRGEEWIPSTPKHIILYKAFGWTLPTFAHLPMILGEDKSKLSKRHGAKSALDYRDEGYMADTIVNFLVLLGWNPGTDQEIFSRDELINSFSIERVHKAPAVFNEEKLDWMSGSYIREMSIEDFTKECLPYLIVNKYIVKEGDSYNVPKLTIQYSQDELQNLLALEQERIKKFSEISELTSFFFDQVDYSADLLQWKQTEMATIKDRLNILKDYLSGLDPEDFNREELEIRLKQLIAENNLSTGEVLWPMRAALTGAGASPSPFEVAEVLGKELTLKRLDQAIAKI